MVLLASPRNNRNKRSYFLKQKAEKQQKDGSPVRGKKRRTTTEPEGSSGHALAHTGDDDNDHATLAWSNGMQQKGNEGLRNTLQLFFKGCGQS